MDTSDGECKCENGNATILLLIPLTFLLLWGIFRLALGFILEKSTIALSLLASACS